MDKQLAITVHKLGNLIINDWNIQDLLKPFPQEFKVLLNLADREAREILFQESDKII